MKIWRWVMIAFCTKWSLPAAERRDLCCWFELVAGLAKEAGERLGNLGRFFLSAEVACLGQYGLLCSKMMILLDIESENVAVSRALRRFGDVIRQMEEAPPTPST